MVTLAADISLEQLEPHLYCLDGAEAIRHLFRVAASLDSMVVGEPQILGQVKEAYDVALIHKATGVVLNKVMKKAISVGKRVRTETGIAEHAVSVSYAAVELAKKIFQNLSEKTVLLVGIGEMGDRKSTRLNSSHSQISYAVFCLKKKKKKSHNKPTVTRNTRATRTEAHEAT